MLILDISGTDFNVCDSVVLILDISGLFSAHFVVPWLETFWYGGFAIFLFRYFQISKKQESRQHDRPEQAGKPLFNKIELHPLFSPERIERQSPQRMFRHSNVDENPNQ